jgi:phosphoenolpyruvate carboxylase
MNLMKNAISIPKTMSTQHPDNVNVPEWCKAQVIDGNAEVFEAYYAYETLGCQEVMWDSEGKDVDTRVLRKLMDKHWKFFEHNIVGKDEFLTYRIPNPKIEAIEKKVVTETLQNIPMAYDAASSVYKKDITPIFEVILPFTTDGKEPIWLYNYYKNAIVHDEEAQLDDNTKAKDWVGPTNPKAINVIPLVEDFASIYNVDTIVRPYIKTIKPKHMRVFIARSDPALNYGLICAVILSKIGLYKLKQLEKQENVPIHPILGVGSKPFRGHLAPDNTDCFLQEYKGLSTVTVQSAVRYDYPIEQVQELVKTLNKRLPNEDPDPISTEEEKLLTSILDKCKKQYENVVEVLAPLINCIFPYVPQRRARKLHIGLFGYSRNVAGISLPRAIPFSSSLYSIGVPPEFIGAKVLEDLTEPEYKVLTKTYVNLKHDYCSVSGYVSWENVNMLMEMHSKVAKRAGMNVDTLRLALTRIITDFKTVEETLDTKLGPRTFEHRKHENFTNNFLINYLENEETEARKALIEAAKIRRCLG